MSRPNTHTHAQLFSTLFSEIDRLFSDSLCCGRLKIRAENGQVEVDEWSEITILRPKRLLFFIFNENKKTKQNAKAYRVYHVPLTTITATAVDTGTDTHTLKS